MRSAVCISLSLASGRTNHCCYWAKISQWEFPENYCKLFSKEMWFQFDTGMVVKDLRMKYALWKPLYLILILDLHRRQINVIYVLQCQKYSEYIIYQIGQGFSLQLCYRYATVSWIVVSWIAIPSHDWSWFVLWGFADIAEGWVWVA